MAEDYKHFTQEELIEKLKEKDKQTSEIIGVIADRLQDSTMVGWSTGGIEEWADHANRMKDTIRSVVPVLKVIKL